MEQALKTANIIGAAVAITFYLSATAVFSLRIAGRQDIAYWVGIFELCLSLPLIYLLIISPGLGRPAIYYIQIILMLAWLVLELFLDYILKYDFRNVRWMLISYVVFFFAASGGLLGVATNAGKPYMIVSVILFLIMAAMTFIQRGITGL